MKYASFHAGVAAFALAVFMAQPQPPESNIRIATDDGSSFVLPPLNPSSDSKPALQSAIDWCESHPGRETLIIPAGTWKIGSAIELVSNVRYECTGVTIEPLDPATYQRSLLFAGASTHPGGGGTRPRCDDVEVTGLTLRQSAATSELCYGLFCVEGDRWRLTQVVVKDGKHEGLVSGAFTKDWIWDRCEAHNCGAGSVHRPQSGAGLNCNGIRHTLIRPKVRDCGQGIEHGGSGITILEPDFANAAPPAGPSIGINIGNAVAGVYRSRVLGGTISGYSTAISVGNVNGRCSDVGIDGVQFANGTIGFSGGKETNIVPHPDEGPDIVGSFIRRCRFTFTTATNGAVMYGTGPETSYNLYGREPLTIEDCVAEFSGVLDQAAPPFSVGGGVSAAVVFRRCEVKGLDYAPPRGDFQSYSYSNNPAPTPSGHLRFEACKSTKADGSSRWFKPMRDSAEVAP